MEVFVVGDFVEETENGITWILEAVYDCEQAALDSIEEKTQFIGPVTIGKTLPDNSPWPGAYYPLWSDLQ